jgi:hypothetical protein
VLRTRLKSADRRRSAVRSVGSGPWDPEPDGGLQPDVLAARLLAFISGRRGPDGPLTDDQRGWFSSLGPEVNPVLPREESAAVEWTRGVASLRLVEVVKMRVARQCRWRATRIFTTSQLRTSSSCATACGLMRSAVCSNRRRVSVLGRDDGLELLKPSGSPSPRRFCCGLQQAGGQRKSQQVWARCRAAGVANQRVQPPDRQRVQPGRGVPS